MPESKYKKHFVWGVLNGMILGILLIDKIDISQTGLASQIIGSMKPLFKQANISTFWITIITLFLGILGIISLIIEIREVYNAGSMAITFASLGFLGIFIILLQLDFGVWFLIMAMTLFATEQYWE